MATLQIDADFPGGNIIVDAIDGDHVMLRQDIRDSSWWFYWYFRVRHAAGRTLRFTLNDIHWVISSQGPCVSTDHGASWRWLGPTEVNTFTYTFPADAETVYFSMGIPYVESHLRAFLADHALVAVESLAVSQQGREIEHLRMQSAQGACKVVLVARHHASEAMANYVLEGILAYWGSEEAEAAFLREQVDLHAVPFMDKDGVENGDPGKNRLPHDHNRDYTETPIYPAVRALIEQVGGWRGRFALVIDLHCPWIRGEHDEAIYLYEPETPWMAETVRFMDTLDRAIAGPFTFTRANNAQWGVKGNSAPNVCAAYLRNHFTVDTAFSIEFPYALADGIPMTVDGARAFGRDMGRAIARFVQGLPGHG